MSLICNGRAEQGRLGQGQGQGQGRGRGMAEQGRAGHTFDKYGTNMNEFVTRMTTANVFSHILTSLL